MLDTGATLSIVARRLLKTLKKTKTVAIRVGDGRSIHSLGGVDVTICLGDETVTQNCRVLDTDAFDIVIRTDFLRRNPQVKMLSLQRPYSLHCDFGSGLFFVPLELSGQKESGLRYATKTSYRTENYQLARQGWRPSLIHTASAPDAAGFRQSVMMPVIVQLWVASDTLAGGALMRGMVWSSWRVRALRLASCRCWASWAGVCTPVCLGFLLGRSAVWKGVGQEGA